MSSIKLKNSIHIIMALIFISIPLFLTNMPLCFGMKMDTNVLSEQAKSFAQNILTKEKKKGRTEDDQVTRKEIDRLLWEYTPDATNMPRVVSKEEFEKIIADGRKVFYKGVVDPGRSFSFKYDNLLDYISKFKSELNGLYCTTSFEYALSYAKENQNPTSNNKEGSVIRFCFTNPSDVKIITYKQIDALRKTYKNNINHIKEDDLSNFYTTGFFSLKDGLMSLDIDSISFIPRACGYDLVNCEMG